MDAQNIDMALIEKQELFSNLEPKELDFIISHSGVFDLPKTQFLFSSGEKASNFYILTKGEIRVFKKNNDGSEDGMAHFMPGDTIGDFDFARGAEYDAFAKAVEDSQLIVFPSSKTTMDALAVTDPKAICRIQLNAIVMMTGRIKSINRLILDNMSWVQDLHRRVYEDAGTGLWKQTLIADEITGLLKKPSALIMMKPDRFKILVDSRGHNAGDEAMIKIAIILKNITRIIGHGWPLRFKSNEVGIIINNCDESQAKNIANSLKESIAAMETVPAAGEHPEFNFSATISWCIWPDDGDDWNTLLSGNYANLLDTWKSSGGNTIIHYKAKA
ncbi:MAG: diguanylate cyclase [Treponema sp.]|nr:diguanylate cyclase [Treponema sp.]